MARHEIMELVLEEFDDANVKSIDDVVAAFAGKHTNVSVGEIRSALLGLLRRNDLELTDNFELRRINHCVAA